MDANQDIKMDRVNSVLAQKLGLTPPEAETDVEPDVPESPMRQMRRALARAADEAVSLTASVIGIAEDKIDAENMIDTGPEGWVVLGLRGAGTAGLTGLFLLDPPLRSALVEMQTMGHMLSAAEQERAVTGTDAVMCAPFADQLLKQLAETGFGAGEYEPASYDMGPIEDLRTAGLVLTQGQYHTWRITIQLSGGDRQGEIMIAMRPKVDAVVETEVSARDWSSSLRRVLEDAPADMMAILTKMTLPISKIEEFEVGQVVPLAGTTVGSVTLVGPDSKPVTTARLGQVAGKRAVRIEPVQIELQDDMLGAGGPATPPPAEMPPEMGGAMGNAMGGEMPSDMGSALDHGNIGDIPDLVES